MTPQKKQKRKNQNTNDVQPITLAHTNEELNLKVLRRLYPNIETTLHIAPYAVLYTFSATQQWEKTGIEGTLFIVHQSPDSTISTDIQKFSVIILNRRGLDNFIAELNAPEEIEATEEFIILSGGSEDGSDGHGLWIFSEPPPSSTAHMREVTGAVMTECAKRASDSIKAVEAAKMEEQAAKAEELEGGQSIPALGVMGRQLSLLELFGKQREVDAGFSVHDHHSSSTPEQATRIEMQTETKSQPLFKPNRDTEFFRTTSTPVKNIKPTSTGQPAPGSIAVEDLFRS